MCSQCGEREPMKGRTICVRCRTKYITAYRSKRRAEARAASKQEVVMASPVRKFQSSAEVQALINANAAEQQALLQSDEDDKSAKLKALQDKQRRLYSQRDAARRYERSGTPTERVGVQPAPRTEAEVWAELLDRV